MKVAFISRQVILVAVARALAGSELFFHHRLTDGMFVATGFVVFPLDGYWDNISMIDAIGCASKTKDGVEESVADALIGVAQRELGVVVDDYNLKNARSEREEKDRATAAARALCKGWDMSLEHLDSVQHTVEEICVYGVDDCPSSVINSLAAVAAV